MPDQAEQFSGLSALPNDAIALLEAAGARDFFGGVAWWATMEATGIAAGGAVCFVVCREGGRSVAVWPMLAGDGLRSLTNAYTCLYAPAFAADLPGDGVRRAGAAFGRVCRSFASVRIDALAPEDRHLPLWLAGVRDAGMVVRRFDHFGNWHEDVSGLDWAAYLHARPGVLRETVRRKMRRAGRETDIVYEMVRTPEAVEAGIAAYEDVYARSWKVPEPFARFNPQMMRAAAGIGALRLGILRRGAAPFAVQCWVVVDGVASVLKLAHDEAEKALSPGTLLSALVIRDLLDQEHVRALDFGRGDDDYKQLWVRARRQRIGVMLFNARRPAGLLLLGRQMLGALRRRVR